MSRVRLVLSLWLAIVMSTSAAAHDPSIEQRPATVVVAFDRDNIDTLIVEGLANRETARAVAANDPVRIASISKLIMALATLRLAEQGVVDLDADVSSYLGWSVRAPGFPETPVTLRLILSHRSGLRDNAGYIVPLGESLSDKLADPAAWYGDAAPGQAPFEYANLGSPLVATVLEAATGERYDALVERTVFAPLGITACLNWVGCGDEQVARAVTLYRDTGDVARDDPADLPPNCTIPVTEGVECDLDAYRPGSNASIFSPQGGVRIGMIDLARLGQVLARGGDGFLSAQGFTAFLSSAEARVSGQEFFCGYGLGVQKIETSGRPCVDGLFADGRERFGHAGEAYGLRAGLWWDPQTGEGIAYFTTAVPPRESAEDEGGFDPRELELVRRARTLLAERAKTSP